MEIKFVKEKAPVDLLREKFDIITKESGFVVYFNYRKKGESKPQMAYSVENVSIEYDISVRNTNSPNFNLSFMKIKHGLKRFPLYVLVNGDILKHKERQNEYDYYMMMAENENELQDIIDEIINDKDFNEIINSIFNLG